MFFEDLGVCGGPACDGLEVNMTLPKGFGICFFESQGVKTASKDAPDAEGVCA